MAENGVGAFIVESRPHPDFLGQKWWDDLRVILRQAKKYQMQVWLFDDSAYPSGYANGRIPKEYQKKYMRICHVEAFGPQKDASFFAKAWVETNERLLYAIAIRRRDTGENLCFETAQNITSLVQDGILYWDIPEGNWRVFFVIETQNGGEEATRCYVNPIQKGAGEAYLSVVYEAHWRQLGEEFGKTLQGFFMDEPRFGNAAAYDRKLGERYRTGEFLKQVGMVLPYAEDLLPLLLQEIGVPFETMLPLLWYDDSPAASDARYAYMQVVTRLFQQRFMTPISTWCHVHGVKLVGHVVEDCGAHARLGYGAGHYFRSMQAMDAAGIDVVNQIWPDITEGKIETPFGYYEVEFFYWGLSKLASSLAHLSPHMHNTVLCEIFGAYGWQEGLRLMKWLTDHVCVRGINVLVPHAFSPKVSDPDCPPHFYAAGKNPQWPYFSIWAEYAARICTLLSIGQPQMTAAVLYHAEAEWGGAAQPFESVVHVLSKAQTDCDVVPIDILCSTQSTCMDNSLLHIGINQYRVVIIPFAQHIPAKLATSLLHFAQKGLPVVFVDGLPFRIYYQKEDILLEQLRQHPNVAVVPLRVLDAWMLQKDLYDVKTSEPQPALRVLHQVEAEKNIYFFTNESTRKKVETTLTLCKGDYELYDPMENKTWVPVQEQSKSTTQIKLLLAPYQSAFLRQADLTAAALTQTPPLWAQSDCLCVLSKGWHIDLPFINEQPCALRQLDSLQNLAAPQLLPRFSGAVRYRTKFLISKDINVSNRVILLDLGEVYEISEVWLNQKKEGVKICPPHRYILTNCNTGENELEIIVVNTLAKQYGENAFDRAMPQEPTGLLGPVKILLIRNEKGRIS